MVRNSKNKRRCEFEALENRHLLAGNVTAQIVNGNLIVTGDNSDNVILISSTTATPTTITVTGLGNGVGGSTVVNGGASGNVVALTGFTGQIRVNMKGGNDNLAINSVASTGIEANLGDGNDKLTISESVITGNLKVDLGKGN